MGQARVAVITGAARGIGLACARRLVEGGAKVVLGDIDDEAGELAAEELGRDRAVFVRCDIGERLAAHNLVAETLTAFDRLDILINNAGIVEAGDVLSLSEANFDRVLGVNLKGAFLASQAAAKQMVAQIQSAAERIEDARRRYSIINISSVNGVTAMPDQLAYNVSKGGLDQLTRSMALSLARRGIRVNSVAPGSVNTDVLRAVLSNDEAMARMVSRTPMGRIADPDEVANVVNFLASPEASYITGEVIYVDGGRRALNMVMDQPR